LRSGTDYKRFREWTRFCDHADPHESRGESTGPALLAHAAALSDDLLAPADLADLRSLVAARHHGVPLSAGAPAREHARAVAAFRPQSATPTPRRCWATA